MTHRQAAATCLQALRQDAFVPSTFRAWIVAQEQHPYTSACQVSSHRCLAGKAVSRCSSTRTNKVDVAIIGSGHNGLVSAILLARSGLKVQVMEEKTTIGGACKTEYPFPKVPGLGQSTGAYLLGVMPPELIQKLGLNVRTIRRDPHYFLPGVDGRYLLFGQDSAATEAQFNRFFSPEDWVASEAMNRELAQLREDLGPCWLQEPASVEATAESFVRPALRRAFLDLCSQPISHYLARFNFKSELVQAMYATTDAFSGLNGGWDTPGTGMNFLAHNMCRLEAANGTWMVVEGGMGSVTQQLAALAHDAGVDIRTDCTVEGVLVEASVAVGVRVNGDSEVRSAAVLCNADPFRLSALVPPGTFPVAFETWVESLKKDGSTMKVNLALRGLPEFTCLPHSIGQHNSTIHLLPPEGRAIDSLQSAFHAARNGELPEFPAIEWYIHTPVDPSLQDAAGHHSSAFFVQWVPHTLKDSTWEAEEDRYVEHLLSIADRFAPGTSDLVADTFTLTPPKIESHFGITSGHIHHVDNSFGFDQRYPYATPLPGLYSCSAGTHPAGSVIGAAGHNAANRLLRDLGLPQH